ncbi:MAG: alcohol dehydrogenase catalytic domain-containing protein [Rhodococcus qingshengii]
MPGSVRIRVEFGGICGSDLHYWRHGGVGTSIVSEPIVLGHEIAGRIVDVAGDVSDVEPGSGGTVHPAVFPLPGLCTTETPSSSRRTSITSAVPHAYRTAMERSVNTSSSVRHRYEYFRRTSMPGSR